MNVTDDQLDELLTSTWREQDVEAFGRYAAEADRRRDERERRLNAPGALAIAARWYAANGIAVFPLRPGEKKPLLPAAHPAGSPERATCRGECGRLGHGLYDATTDPAIITRWWTTTPRANIGVPTGRLFDVIDIDGPAGYRSLIELRAAGALPPFIGTVRTPGDSSEGRAPGMHYYILPTGDGNSSKVMAGMDYRGAGGYVVAPPSIRPDDRYDWIVPLALPRPGA